jgi:hypothetical protein
MIPDKVLYTDGHQVTVTDSVFQVKNDQYRINGITKHGFLTVKPHRFPGILLLIVGIIVGGLGIMKMISPDKVHDIQMNGTYITGNTLAIIIGSLLVLVGILVTGLMRERYAVRIATAEGEKNVIVSSKKEYVKQIVDALNEAFNFSRPNKGFSHYTVQ